MNCLNDIGWIIEVQVEHCSHINNSFLILLFSKIENDIDLREKMKNSRNLQC